jgi:hypothetical protein
MEQARRGLVASARRPWQRKTPSGKPLAEADFSRFLGVTAGAQEKSPVSGQSRFDHLPSEDGEPIRCAGGT